jgi:hypothetical protein
MKPCIFVHQGYQDYLNHIFDITRRYNKNNRLILLGDNSNKHVAEKYNFEFYQLADYTQEIPYYHFSTNGEKYEKFCFQRWFIVKNFCVKNNISDILYSDSDNALFVDFSTITYTNARIGMPHQHVVPNILFITIENLVKICDYYLEIYSLPVEQFKERIKKYSTYEFKNILHYSDMYFFLQAITEMKLDFITLPEHNVPLIFNGNAGNYNVMFEGDILVKKDTKHQIANLHFQANLKSLAKTLNENAFSINKSITPVIFKYECSYNIGDDVQTIAAINFIESIIDKKHINPYIYIDRDNRGKKNADILKEIVNPVIFCYGWFSSNSDLSYLKNIPTINLSMHYAGEENTYHTFCTFLSGRRVLSRDVYTKELIKRTNDGIDCTFGGCLTLFLKPTTSIVENYTYVVQVESEFPLIYNKYIRDKFPNIISVSQDRPNSSDKTKEASEHLLLIERAKYVISSRIHTAIPCLAYRKNFSLIKFPNEKRLTGFSQLFNEHWIHPNKITTELLCPTFCGNVDMINELYEINKNQALDKILKLVSL